MPKRLEAEGQLAIAARRFRRILYDKSQVVIVTNKTPRVDTMLCAAAMELHINDLDSRIGITRIQDTDESWYDSRFDGAMVIIINTKLTADYLYLLALKTSVLIIDSRESVFKIVNEHNAKYDVTDDKRVELGVPAKGYSAAFIGWSISNRYVGNSHNPIVIPPVLTLLNEYSAQGPDDSTEESVKTLPTTLYEYLETIYQGGLEQTRELLAGTEETLSEISQGYQNLRSAKSLVAMKIAKRHATAVTVDGYKIDMLRMNVPKELMDIVGSSIRNKGSYVLLYELIANQMHGRVYYGENWSDRMQKHASNPEVERLRINIGGEPEEYGFSFSAWINRPVLFKSASDVLVKSLLQNEK